MPAPAIHVEIVIDAAIDRIWELTQAPDSHSRWDLRFSRITPIEHLTGGGYRFRYERAFVLHTIRGIGTSIGETDGAGGARTSALRFGTDDRLSPLGAGRGYWRYVPSGSGVRFVTGYDYEPAWGRALDRILVRPIVGWMTAWSFDRLRIWAETGVEPERWPVWSVLAFWRGDRPRASRCARRPTRGRTMDDAPPTLETLEAP